MVRWTKVTVILLFFCVVLLFFLCMKNVRMIAQLCNRMMPSALNSFITSNEENLEFNTRNATRSEQVVSVDEKCQVVHIVYICTGHRAPLDALPVIQSILYNTKHPLHFHFLSDITARTILREQFVKWKLKTVSVSLHQGEKFKSNVSWIPTQHGSGAFGMMKLILHDILPQEVKKVILLDTDLTCTDDIFHLWEMFDKLNETQMFGVAENRNSWYFGKYTPRPWPAVGRGYNTGVMLLDLMKMRKFNWNNIWRGITRKRLRSYKSTQLGDQDVFNAVIKEHHSFVYCLPCYWNLQLHRNDERSVVCAGDYSEMKIVHWNSVLKYKNTTNILKFFYDLRQKYMSYDLTQEQPSQCS